jgi:cell wall-associated NlpC family hydrolase
MTMEGFVRAAGAAMGAARDTFGMGTVGEGAPGATVPVAPGGSALGAGQAVAAANAASGQLNTRAAALTERNSAAQTQLSDALAAANAGRARMDGVIGGATADVTALAPASRTPYGQRALVAALARRLQHTQQALQDGQADATTHASAAHTTAEAYHSLYPSGGPASASPASASGTPAGAMPLSGLSGLPGVMGAAPTGSGGQWAGQREGANAADSTDSNAVEAVIARALSQHGTPYSWGGGGKHGPGPGDDGRVGFDCSSLMQYAFAGAGVDLPRTTYDQIGLGRPVAPGGIQRGDLIFSQFGEGGITGPGHVQLAISPTHVVEAPHTGTDVQVSAMPTGHVVVRRIL